MDLVIKLISSVWFWVDVVLASCGGLVVYCGLKIEKEAERLLVPSDFRPDIFEDVIAPYKVKIERGWRILMTGIVMEVVAALIISVVSGLEIADANDQASKANERVSNNEVHVAELTKESVGLRTIGENAKESAARAKESEARAIAEAEKSKTEREKAESGRLELEKQLLALIEKTKVRNITPKTRADLALKLKGVPRGNVEIVMSDRDAECLAFGLEIKKSLIAAGFLNVAFSPRDIFRAVEMFPQLAESGTDLVICVKDEKSPPLCAAITLLCFRGDGFNADGWPYNAGLGTNDFQIWVLPKPIHPDE